MTKYYFLVTSLPDLHFGVAPDLSFQEFKTLLKDNLTPSDYAKTRQIRWFYDILNIRAFWKNDPWDHWGNLDVNELKEDLVVREGALPDFVYQFLDEHESLDDRLKYFPMLFASYFDSNLKQANGFLKTYSQFEKNLRLALTGFRARQLGRELTKELQFEDPEGDIVAQLLAQKESKSYEAPVGFEDLKPILEQYYHAPVELQKALVEYRYNKLQATLGIDVFSIDYILLYMVNYIMVDKWTQLDKQKGIEIVDNLVKGIA
jgi:hypothetical protein